MNHCVTIYTDGSCIGNPGPGGWAAIIIEEGKHREITGGAVQTTNNQMELTGVISALRILSKPSNITVYSDSQYIVKAINQHWLEDWKKRGWHRSGGKLLNKELWQELDKLLEKHHVQFKWVRGHSSNKLNNRADALAAAESAKYAKTLSSFSRTPEHELRCPFCGGPVRISVHDAEGNLRDEDYEKTPWYGLSYGLMHTPKDKRDVCPIACEGTLGNALYQSRDEAKKAWKLNP